MPLAQAMLFLAVCLFASFSGNVAALKTSKACYPACNPDRGFCIGGRCLCKSPYGGAACDDVISPDGTVATAGSESPLDGRVASDFAPDDGGARSTFSEVFNPGLPLANTKETIPLQVEAGELGPQARIYSGEQVSDSSVDVASRSNPERDVIDGTLSAQGGADIIDIQDANSQRTHAATSLRRSASSPVRSSTGRKDSMPQMAAASKFAAEQTFQYQARSDRRRGVLRHPLRRRAVGETSALQLATEDAEACIPWLSELRAQDLYNFTDGKGHVEDMKASRLQMFKARTHGHLLLKKTAWHASLPNWFHGPSYVDAGALFNRLDTSGDGALSFEEYNAENLCGFRRSLLEVLATRKETLFEGFRLLDENGDGELQEKEFVAQSAGPLLGLTVNNAKKIFKLCDSDGKPGVLTRTEFQRLGGLPMLRLEVEDKEPDAEIAFRQADKNHDKQIDQAEFEEHAEDMGGFEQEAAILSASHALDLNRDGSIEKSEYVNTCWKSTGGDCNGADSCEQWRGPTFCFRELPTSLHGTCTCAPGFCAKNGLCIPEELHSATDQPLGPKSSVVLQRMQDVGLTVLGNGASNVNPTKGVVALLLGVAVMIQMKSAISTFPWLGMVLFTLSVVAFYIVTTTVLRTLSVPGSIDSADHVVVFMFAFCAVSLSLTSWVRAWSPGGSKIMCVCYYAHDDSGEYGLDLGEELKVRAYGWFMVITNCLCAMGLSLLPPTYSKDTQTKVILLMLYVCIFVLDSCMLEKEVKQCSNRRMPWTLTLRCGPASAHLACISAWWNCKEADGNEKDDCGHVVKNMLTFKSYRQSPNSASGVGEHKRHMSQKDEADLQLREMGERQTRGELLHLTPSNGFGDGPVNYVRGRVVLLWEDTHLQLVVPEGEQDVMDFSSTLSSAGTSTVKRWNEKDTTKWTPVGGVESGVGAPKDENGQYMCPWVRVVDTKRTDSAVTQTVQQQMLVLAQAGAAGLIVGQRDVCAGGLDPSKFGTFPFSPNQLWKGEYKSDGDKKKEVRTRKDFCVDCMLPKAEKCVRHGTAVNTVMIRNMDMEELAWAFEHREALGPDIKAIEVDQRYSMAIEVGDCKRGDAPNAGNKSEVNNFSLRDDAEDGKFRHIFSHQRAILTKVVVKSQSNVQFLADVRNWVTNLSFTKWKIYTYFHLAMTFIGLHVVLELSHRMYQQLHYNNMGKWSVLVLVVTMLNLSNTSFYLDWWPMYIYKKQRNLKPSQHLGAILQTLVIAEYTFVAVGMFAYFGIVKMAL